MNASEIEFAWSVFVDHVVAWTTTRDKVPEDSEAEGLAQKALAIATQFSKVLNRPAQIARPPSPSVTTVTPTLAELVRTWGDRVASRCAGDSGRDLVGRFERYVIPDLGDKAIDAVTPREIFAVLRSIEAKGFVPLAYQIFRDLRAMYRYAVIAGIAPQDPTQVLGSYVRRPRPKNYVALTDPEAIGQLLVAIRNYKGRVQSTTRHMICLAPILFLRPVELRTLEWTDVDLDAATVIIPGPRIKTGRPHIVPLPRQAVKILREVEERTGGGRYVFTGGRGVDKPPTESAFFQMLRRVGYNKIVTPHGFRAMAATWLSEQGWRGEAIERQLSHVGDGHSASQRIYNRAEYLQERRKMLQAWADYLESLERRARVIPSTQLDFSKA